MDRQRCYDCHRPIHHCFCHTIPRIQNQTQLLVLQHRRERFHPFNTARILKKAFLNAEVLADHIDRLREAIDAMELAPSVGLLYPGPHARLLNHLNPADRPEQLVILDGTWHHTKTLFRDIPRLQSLPQFSLAPTEPSRYTIRREPQFHCLSTLEATVAALHCLEPDTPGLDSVLAPFETMIADQVAHPKSPLGVRRNIRRSRPIHHVPRRLRDPSEQLLAVYGETLPTFSRQAGDGAFSPRSEPVQPVPLLWTAERLATGERFRCLIRPTIELASSFLRHLQLDMSSFEQALSWPEAQQCWSAFLQPRDTLLYYYANLPKLLAQLGCEEHSSLSLKGIPLFQSRIKHRVAHGDSLMELLEDVGQPEVSIPGEARADRRLRATARLARYLQAC